VLELSSSSGPIQTLTDLFTPSGHGLLGPDHLWVFVVVFAAAVVVGAATQSIVGLGLGLVLAPALSLLDPTLMPGSVLITSVVMPLFMLFHEWRHVDWRGLAWGLPARVPGTILGAWVVALLEPRALAGAIGVMVLAAVALSLRSFRVRITPGSLMAAGALSGVTGTATSVSGPPLALLYQYEEPARVRATLAAFFLVGSVLSLATLAAGGQMEVRQVVVGAAAVPFLGVGLVLGRALRRRVDQARLRTAMLVVVTASALGLLVQAVLG